MFVWCRLGEANHLPMFTLVRMRFKKKRDDVKALHATMKELQGIDPLDYLARYNNLAIDS